MNTKPKRRSHRLRKPRVSPADRMAMDLLPAAQVAQGGYELTDIANDTDADHRKMVRSGERKTLRKLTKIEKLHRAGIIDKRQAAACEWYQSAYEECYEARVKIANWAATGGCSDRAFGHWPAGKFLEPGDNLFAFARKAISPAFLPMFERVVLHGRPLGKLTITFRMAAKRLAERLEGFVEL